MPTGLTEPDRNSTPIRMSGMDRPSTTSSGVIVTVRRTEVVSRGYSQSGGRVHPEERALALADRWCWPAVPASSWGSQIYASGSTRIAASSCSRITAPGMLATRAAIS
jgi:pyrimidine deaminase RibD-like protein